MKKLLLLLTAGSIGLSLHAQENRSILFQSAAMQHDKVVNEKLPSSAKNDLKAIRRQHETANKTTSITSRWYNYVTYIDTFLNFGSSGNTTDLTAVTIWNDTLGQLNFTSGLAHNTMVSVGSVFQPQAHGFNDPQYFAGEMQLTTESFQIDSIDLFGLYEFNPAKTGVVDTVTITFTQGSVATSGDDIFFSWFTDATVLSNYGVPSTERLVFALERYDSTLNTANGTSAYSFKFNLTSANWGDTFANGIFHKEIKLPTAYNVTSGNQVGVAISFKSGDATFVPNDTLNAEYNHLRPLFSFVSDGTNPVFPPYDSTDFNSGQFKSLPNFENGWEDVYVPMYAWTSGGNASALQYNNMDFHVVCTSCNKIVSVNDVVKNVSNVGVYPNPAQTQVNINFNLTNTASATVTLTNTLGQVVASQESTGKATFNTASLPAGVYVYSILANGQQTTGRITVAH